LVVGALEVFIGRRYGGPGRALELDLMRGPGAG
jgi:hypothetical protein